MTIVVRPRINRDGVSKPMWVGNIFAWGSDKVGVGHNPKSDPDYDDRFLALMDRARERAATLNSEP